MQLSLAGRKLLRVEEGVKLRAYRDTTGRWTIAVGQTMIRGRPVQEGDVLTQDEAEALFNERVQEFEADLTDAIKVPVSQEQFDALFSLAWNIGVDAFKNSTLLRKLNAGDYAGAAEQFDVWNKVTLRGELTVADYLVARRTRERRMFESAQPTPAPVEESKPVYTAPEEKKVVAPVIAAIIPALAQKLLEVLPWFSTGSPQAERSIKVLQTVGPPLIEMAKAASGQAGAVEAVDAVVNDATVRQTFVQSAAEKWDELKPMLEFEESSRQKAREWATQMTQGSDWRAVGMGALLATVLLGIIFGGGWMLWELMIRDGMLTAEQRGMVLGTILAIVMMAAQYILGTSATSRSKDRTIKDMTASQS